VPTIGVGQRIEADEGVTVSSLQANPGKMTRADHYANAWRLHQAGVTLLPGTDVGINLTDFSEEFFFEMEAFVDVGLTPLETIHAGTALAASHLGIDDVTGALRPGLAADVLVVEGRPDVDITALRQPLLVLKDGWRILPTTPPPAPSRDGRA
jgi:imidazolonepropionase-like amidohydrolase